MIAPAKLNLCLYLGGTRPDGLHDLCSLFAPLELADRIVVEDLPAGEPDEVVCEGVEGPNLAGAALAALRDSGWGREPVRIVIEKRIPVAAGLGGGSADAAAVLRLAADEIGGLEEIAVRLGADVVSQLDPAFALVEGSGERLTPLPAAGGWGAVLVPDPRGLSTADVYREADRLGLARDADELVDVRARLVAAAGSGASPLDYVDLLVNDLGEAAISLRPSIAEALEALRAAGAAHALVTGSGPTAVGLFEDFAKAGAGASRLGSSHAGAIVTGPMSPAARGR